MSMAYVTALLASRPQHLENRSLLKLNAPPSTDLNFQYQGLSMLKTDVHEYFRNTRSLKKNRK